MVLHGWNYWYGKLREREIRDRKALWINSFLRHLAFSFVGIFSIIFIFETGKKHFLMGGVEGGILLVLVYELVVRGTILVSVIPMGEQVIRKIGYRRSVWVSLMCSVCGLLSLSMATGGGMVKWILTGGFWFGLGISLYWVTYYSLLSGDAVKSELGSSYGVLEAISLLGRVLAPLVGGIVVYLTGFGFLFWLGAVILVASVGPMFFLKPHHHGDRVSWQEFYNWQKSCQYRRTGVAIGSRMIHDLIMEVFWPVFVFLVVGSVLRMGVYSSAALLSTALFSIAISKWLSKTRNFHLRLWAAVGTAAAWLMRGLVSGLGEILLVDTTDRFLQTTWRSAFFGVLLRKAKGRNMFSFVVYWYVWESWWCVTALLVMALVLLTGGIVKFWILVFTVAGLAGITTLWLRDDNND